MTSFLFWTLATLLTAAALYSLLKPLLRRIQQDDPARETSLVEIYRERSLQLEQQHQRGELDTDQLHAAREELEASLAMELPEHEQADKASSPDNRKIVSALVGVSVPLAAVILYLMLGMPAAIDGGQTGSRGGADQPMLSIDEMVLKLEQRLQANPEDARGWIMLGRTYTALNQLGQARQAYLEAVKRAPANAEVLFHLTEVTAALQNNSLSGEPETYLNLGLQLDPQSRQGRWLLGILAFQQGDPEKAVGLWEQLLAEGDNAEEQELLKSFIQEARNMMPGEELARAPASTEESPAASPAPDNSAGSQVSVSVRLADNLATRVSDNDTLFVYAKAASGPPMPLAIVRTTAGKLPLRVTLDDSQAMMPQMKLSSFNQVIINARISKSGNATPTPGDLQGVSKTIDPASNPVVDVVIDSIAP